MNTRRIIQSLLFVALLLGLSAASFGGVFISVNVGPPPLPVYEQPPIPGPGYIWTPGYWAWGDEGYYWVPGTWVEPPEAGLLWTPGYWGWNDGAYMWNAGYWGPHVGFYGGIDYGFGYTGVGYEGGYWRGRDFYYNRSVNNINVTNIRNVYNRTVVVNNRSRVSYNGGNGGVQYRETQQQRQWRNERHIEATNTQREHVQQAARNRELLARNNGGRPPIAATERPTDFSHHVAARAAGGHVDRAALNATPKNMPARTERSNRAENKRTTDRTRTNDRTANRNEVPRPSNASRTESGARNNERTREATPASARTERNVPKPPSASERNTRTENAHNVPKPSASTSARAHENANARVATPRGNTHARENANAHVATPRENNHPATAATRPEPSERSTRSMGMPQGEHAPAPRAESHPAPRPAEHNSPQPHAQANPHPAPQAHAAPQHEASKPVKNEPPKEDKKH